MTTNNPSDSNPEINERIDRANAIVRKFVLLSIGAGAVPIPIFDVAASVGLQLKLIQELSDLYGLDHRRDLVRNALGTIATTAGGLVIGSYLGATMSKLVPGAGTKVGIVKTAAFFGVSTHISGKFLIMHFEAGGTLLDFNPVVMRNFFQDEYEKSAYAVRREQEESGGSVATS
jgi:uncharacterized protein (DUF697 family)